MSDNNNQKLNDYGVWVKKPPRTIDSTNNPSEDPFNDFSITTGPEFTELDENTFDSPETETMNTENLDSSEEVEIDLDEFITGGVFETGPDEDKIKQKEAEMAEQTESSPAPEASGSSDTEDVSLDSFDVSFDDDSDSSQTQQETVNFEEDDDTLNIDLSFDDDSSADSFVATSEPETVSFDSPSADSGDSSESIDLAEFGITEFSDPNPGTPAEESSFESVDMSDFGMDSSSEENTSEASQAPEGTEDVDLSEFGIDFTEESNQNSEPAAETPVSEEPQIAEEPAVFNENDEDSIQMNVEEDKQEEIHIEEPVTFAQENDSDFDIDSILNSATDESGRTVTVGNQEDAIVSEVSSLSMPEDDISLDSVMEEPEIQSESIEDFNSTNEADEINFDDITQEIPDTFDEEAASLTADELSNIASSVVTTEENIPEEESLQESVLSEPVFEEPAVTENTSDDFEQISFDETTFDDSVSESESIVEDAAEETVFDAGEMDNSILEESAADDEFQVTEEPELSIPEPETAEINDVSEITETAEQAAPAERDSTVVANSILQDIVGQLSALKSEISTLKEDLTNLKNNNAVAPTPAELGINTETEDTGFFSSTDGDDTIALSSDELANILNTSEITEASSEDYAPAEEQVTEPEVTSDFADESFEEPALDLDTDLEEDNFETEVIDSELPEEIAIPKVDGLVVDSSSTDLMAEDSDNEAPLEINDEVFEELAEELPDLTEMSEEGVDTELTEETVIDANKSFDDIFAPDLSIDESLTAGNLDYLSNDENASVTDGEASADYDTTSASSAEGTENSESSIPNELQTEIKSVLSYMDQLLENLPEEKIAEFAQSEQFETYKKLFKELGLS